VHVFITNRLPPHGLFALRENKLAALPEMPDFLEWRCFAVLPPQFTSYFDGK
jgi:hypothetical protein